MQHPERTFSMRTPRAEQGPSLRWWVASVVLHGLIYLWLLIAVVSGAGKGGNGPSRKPPVHNLTTRQSEQATHGRQAQTQRARENVAQLESIRNRLEKIRATRHSQLNQLSRQLKQSALRDARSALQKADAAVQKTLQAQVRAQQSQQAASKSAAQQQSQKQPSPAQPNQSPRTPPREVQAAARAQQEAQAAAVASAEAQAKAAGAMAFAGDQFKKAREAVEAAQRKQMEATELQKQANEAQARIAPPLPNSIPMQPQMPWTPQAQQQAQAAQRKAQQAQEEARRAQQRASQELTKATENQKQQQQPTATPRDRSTPTRPTSSKSTRTQPVSPAKPDQQSKLKEKDLAGLYKAAVEIEKKISAAHGEIRAADLAMIQKIPLDQAASATAEPAPTRPTLDRKLLDKKPRTADEWQAQQKEMSKARNEIESMVARSQSLVEQAQSTNRATHGASVSLDENQAKPEQEKKLQEAARAGTGGTAKDLTAIMKQSQQSGAGRGDKAGAGKSGTGKSTGGKSTGGKSTGGKSSDGKSGGGKISAGQRGRSRGGKGTTGGANPGEGKGSPKGQRGNSSGRYRYGSGVGGDAPVPKKYLGRKIWSDAVAPPLLAAESMRPIPGRKVMSGVSGASWMYVDSWYTIGPFPNPNRINLHKKFPPENGIDLDAVYVGKDNRPVRWKFVQTASPLLVPASAEEYAVYYAYTEMWFDRAHDLWIAVGSDDASKLWIENQLVWQSTDALKPWRQAEGLRKVHFKKGLNRILYRVENGIIAVGMSLTICLKPAP